MMNYTQAAAPGQLLVCEYLGAYEPAMLDNMSGRLRYYAKIGLRGVMFTYGSPVNFKPVWAYVWPRMSWDPAQNPHALAKEFINSQYGSSAEAITRFFDLTHERYKATLASGEKQNDANYTPNFYSPDFVMKALACFNDAVKASEKPEMKKQLQAEKLLFLGDVVRHMPDNEFTEQGNVDQDIHKRHGDLLGRVWLCPWELVAAPVPRPLGDSQSRKKPEEIQNISGRGWFAGCWFLLSDATLTFEKAEGK